MMNKGQKYKREWKHSGKGAEAEMDFVAYFIIAVIVLAIGIIAYLVLSGKGANAIEYIKGMFRNLFSGG